MKPVLKKVGHWQLLLVLLVALALCMGMGGARANEPAPLLNTSLLFDSPLPPDNDNLLDAKVVTTLPYSDVLDNTGATGEPSEPWGCWSSQQPERSVWYRYDAPERMLLRANMDGSNFYAIVLSVYEATGPVEGFEDLSCISSISYGGSLQFWVKGGGTYYFQAMDDIWVGGGSLHFNLEQVSPPANDNFINARLVGGLPYSDSVELSAATTESGEPKPSCVDQDPLSKTVWYAFTPVKTQRLTAWTGDGLFRAAYTGGSLSDLSEVACSWWEGPMNLVAEAEQTYYFQFGSRDDAWGWFSFSLEVTPPPSVDFGYWPGDPSLYETVNFNAWCWDPANLEIDKQTWDLGDGTAAEGCCPSHRYAADGDYTASLTCTTIDGRSGTSVKTIPVRTHDVAITRLAVPKSAKAGQTRQISVEVKNKQYEEPVRVELYRSIVGGFEYIGFLTQVVPVRGGNRTTLFAFSYTFTSADATLGKVTFKAVANLQNARDALPADNEAIASPTKVSP